MGASKARLKACGWARSCAWPRPLVNADIGKIEVIFVPEEDRDVNPLGTNGIGELGTTGMNAAVANAVYHATGIRVRKLPLRLDALLA